MEAYTDRLDFYKVFLQKEKEWIGGILEDWTDNTDPKRSTITGFDLRQRDNDVFFTIYASEHNATINIRNVFVISGKIGWITFSNGIKIKRP